MRDIKTDPRSIRSLIDDIRNKYNFDLPIQRRAGIWSKKESGLFIDSVIRLYPIYPSLLNKHSDTGVVDVIDFKQRFLSLADFEDNKFALSRDLKPVIIDDVEYEIAGKKFKKLDDAVKKRFYNRDLTVITMVDATPEEISDIFDRINMGHPLSNGHKRSTLESDETREIIYSLASNDFFSKTITKAQRKRNIDRDVVIQLLMFCETDNGYELSSFRNNDMNKFILYYNDLPIENRGKAVSIIEEALNILNAEFPQEKLKIGLSSIALCCYGAYQVIRDNKDMGRYLEWLRQFIDTYSSNEEYNYYCTEGTASAEKVKGRFAYFNKALGML